MMGSGSRSGPDLTPIRHATREDVPALVTLLTIPVVLMSKPLVDVWNVSSDT